MSRARDLWQLSSGSLALTLGDGTAFAMRPLALRDIGLLIGDLRSRSLGMYAACEHGQAVDQARTWLMGGHAATETLTAYLCEPGVDEDCLRHCCDPPTVTDVMTEAERPALYQMLLMLSGLVGGQADESGGGGSQWDAALTDIMYVYKLSLNELLDMSLPVVSALAHHAGRLMKLSARCL